MSRCQIITADVHIDAVAFSGGRTSGKMLHDLKQSGRLSPRCQVMFANTGKERDETLDFVQQCSEAFGVPVVWLEYNFTEKDGHTFRMVDYSTAARRKDTNSPFSAHLDWLLARPKGSLPNPVQRSCSGKLKHRVMKQYLQSLGWDSWTTAIGIRADESHRTIQIRKDCPSYITPVFPLVEDGVRLEDVDAFWHSQSFTLRLRPHEGNCDLCPLKAQWKIIAQLQEDPSCGEWWAAQERRFAEAGRGNGARWRLDRPSFDSLIDSARSQSVMDFDLNDNDEVSCSCGERMWADE